MSAVPRHARRGARAAPSPRRLARAAFLLALQVGVAVALVVVVRSATATPAERPVSAIGVDAVAQDPASFRGNALTLRGRVVERPIRVSARDRGTFVIAGSRGERLLVVPADRRRLRGFRTGVEVIVRGTVVIPPDSRRLARRAASRTALARRYDAPALVKATEVDLPR
jgi:hypothetical protein